MLHFIKRPRSNVVRLRVTPDAEQARALERKLANLNYTPENGFHKDRWQPRREPTAPATRWAARIA